MTIDEQTKDEKLQYDIKEKLQRYHPYNQNKMIGMNLSSS